MPPYSRRLEMRSDIIEGMSEDTGGESFSGRLSAHRSAILCLAVLGCAVSPACGGHSASNADAVTTTGTGGTAGSASSGSGGSQTFDVRGSNTPTGDVALAVDCSLLPCLTSAVSTVAACQPSHTCTYQGVANQSIVHCFDNGITIIRQNSAADTAMMGVKKAGSPCYALEYQNSAAQPNAGTLEYRDGNNALMVTIFANGQETRAQCPGSDTIVTVPPDSTCMSAISVLGGLMPASACVQGSLGDCQY